MSKPILGTAIHTIYDGVTSAAQSLRNTVDSRITIAAIGCDSSDYYRVAMKSSYAAMGFLAVVALISSVQAYRNEGKARWIWGTLALGSAGMIGLEASGILNTCAKAGEYFCQGYRPCMDNATSIYRSSGYGSLRACNYYENLRLCGDRFGKCFGRALPLENIPNYVRSRFTFASTPHCIR